MCKQYVEIEMNQVRTVELHGLHLNQETEQNNMSVDELQITRTPTMPTDLWF